MKKKAIHFYIEIQLISRTNFMMNNYSYFSNRVLTILSLICISLFAGCYSFTGGSVPDHLKTISLTAVQDNSGFGNPRFRDVLTRRLLDKFRNDNTLVLVESNGDAQLQSTIIRIDDDVVSVSPGEVERERRITVLVEAEYTDYVKRKQVWKRTFSNFQVYLISQGQQAREEAVIAALQQIGEDILLAVVSGW
jgi:outer membrane lipopolysaccharide assembly protein LptE/RlpB